MCDPADGVEVWVFADDLVYNYELVDDLTFVNTLMDADVVGHLGRSVGNLVCGGFFFFARLVESILLICQELVFYRQFIN